MSENAFCQINNLMTTSSSIICKVLQICFSSLWKFDNSQLLVAMNMISYPMTITSHILLLKTSLVCSSTHSASTAAVWLRMLSLLFIGFLVLVIIRRRISQRNSNHDLDLIPGPVSYPLIGTTYLYKEGSYSWERLHLTGMKKYKQFGPVVREEVLPGVNILWLFHPEVFIHTICLF